MRERVVNGEKEGLKSESRVLAFILTGHCSLSQGVYLLLAQMQYKMVCKVRDTSDYSWPGHVCLCIREVDSLRSPQK